MNGLVEHFFRREYGRLLSTLVRRVGVHEIEVVEDAVQSALMSALESWTIAGVPDNPSAWLFRVAHNNLVGEFRQRARRGRIIEGVVAQNEQLGAATSDSGLESFLSRDMTDDLLRMLFVCCDPTIPAESQLVLALKTLCGFDIREIAQRLFMSEANVYKRLARGRNRLRQLAPQLDELDAGQYSSRLAAVNRVLYLLFTEGYLSPHADTAIRRELSDEAIRGTGSIPVGREADSGRPVVARRICAR